MKRNPELALLAAGLLLLAGLLAGCSNIQGGDVVDRDHEPAHYEQSSDPFCDSDFACPPLQRWVEDRYRLKIDGANPNGKPVVGWVDVTSDTYSRCEVGDYWHINGTDGC